MMLSCNVKGTHRKNKDTINWNPNGERPRTRSKSVGKTMLKMTWIN